MTPIILAGSDDTSTEFASGIARALGTDYDPVISKTFPDGEVYVRLPASFTPGVDVILVKSFIPPQDRSIVEFLLTADTLRTKGAERIVAVIPYMAYSRQDREFLENEAVSVRSLLRLIRAVGVDMLITVEIHKEDSLKYFEGPALSVSPLEYMAQFLTGIASPVVIAPDIGALNRASRVAYTLGAEFDYLVKRRNRVTGEVTMEPKELEVKGKDVVLVDDIISTGGTIAKATEILRRMGAESVRVLAVHALMVGNAVEKLSSAGVREIIAANTLPKIKSPFMKYVDIAPVVADRIKQVILEANN